MSDPPPLPPPPPTYVEVDAVMQCAGVARHAWGPYPLTGEFPRFAELLRDLPLMVEFDFDQEPIGTVTTAWVDAETGHQWCRVRFARGASDLAKKTAADLLSEKPVLRHITFGMEPTYLDTDVMFGIKGIKPTCVSLVAKSAMDGPIGIRRVSVVRD